MACNGDCETKGRCGCAALREAVADHRRELARLREALVGVLAFARDETAEDYEAILRARAALAPSAAPSEGGEGQP